MQRVCYSVYHSAWFDWGSRAMKCGYPNCGIVVVNKLWKKDGKYFCSLACMKKYRKGIERPAKREAQGIKEVSAQPKRRQTPLHKRLAFLRRALGLKQKEAAKIAGVGLETYKQVEHGYSDRLTRLHFSKAWAALGEWEEMQE